MMSCVKLLEQNELAFVISGLRNVVSAICLGKGTFLDRTYV